MRKAASDMRAFAFFAVLLSFLPAALGTPTMEEISRSFNQNMDQAPDYSRLIPWLLGAAGIVGAVIFFRQRQKREAVQKALNHPGKLVREVMKIAEIDSGEMKRLKGLMEEHNCASPLTLLLCPSLLTKKTQGTTHNESADSL